MSTFTRHATALCRRAPNAVKAVYGAESAYGPLDQRSTPGLNASGEPVQFTDTVLLLPVDAFVSTLTRHAPITVDGRSYVIRDVRPQDDGLVQELVLAEVP